MKLALGLSFVFAAVVAAQQAQEWAQCGGTGFTGATTCVSGTVCTKQNDFYSQCIPGAAASSVAISSVSPAQPSSAPAPPSVPAKKNNFIFSFGDSYTQTGFQPNGTLPAAGNPLGNPPFPGFTAVGGTNWIDQFTVQYNRTLLFTYNYAFGGATIDASLVAPFEPTVLSLTDQVNQFLSTVANKPASTPWQSSSALFSFWIGINDIGNSYFESGSRDAFSDTLLDAYFALVQKVFNVGARNFLFINVPPVDRSPLMLAQSASAQALEKSVIQGFNTKLAQRVSAFQGNNTGVKTWLWDSNAAFTAVLNNPQAFGFTDNVSFGNEGDFWGNNYHPSSDAHEIWAEKIGDMMAGTDW